MDSSVLLNLMWKLQVWLIVLIVISKVSSEVCTNEYRLFSYVAGNVVGI